MLCLSYYSYKHSTTAQPSVPQFGTVLNTEEPPVNRHSCPTISVHLKGFPLVESLKYMTSGNRCPTVAGNERPLHYRCNALPTELSKPHESGGFESRSKPEFFSSHFSSSVMAAFVSFILT